MKRLRNASAQWRLSSGLLAISALTLGCDRDVTLGGQVSTHSGAPIEKAEVSVACPEVCASAITDATGRFFSSREGACAPECRITVRRSGFQPFSGSAGEHCMPRGGAAGKCRKIWLEPRLLPAADGG